MSINLALGKKATVVSFTSIENSFKRLEYGDDSLLTDGITALEASTDGWRSFADGVGREITVDLGGVYAVESLEISFLHKTEDGVLCPESVGVYLSENGADFYFAAKVDAPYPASFNLAVRARYVARPLSVFRARYAKFVFLVDTKALCDEIRVFGGDCIGIEDTLSGTPYQRENQNRFALPNALDGASNMIAVNVGMVGERKFAISREAFLPLLAYIDKNGRPVDTLFNSVLFVPGINSPSGGVFNYLGPETVMSDWEYLLDELFSPEKNICALEDAVGDVKKALSLDEGYRLKVYITAPVPKISLNPFGDLNGDGIEDKLITTDDCVAAYTWFVDSALRRFNGLNFKHISLDGFLWNNGTFSRRRREDEADFAASCVRVLHDRSLKCIFRPWFQDCGSGRIKDVGFDLSVPSAGFNFDENLFCNINGSLNDYTEYCKRYGFGTEIEVPSSLIYDNSNSFSLSVFDACLNSQLENGAITDAPHIFNQFYYNDTVVVCALSEKAEIRAVYDKLYRFIKGTLTKDMLFVKLNNVSAPDAEADFVSAPLLDKACFADGTEDKVVGENSASPFEKQENLDTALAEEHGADFALIEEEIKAPLSAEGAAHTLPESDGFKPTPKNNTRESKPQKPKNGGANPKRSMHPCHKRLAIGAGIAVAAISVMYVIKKLSDRD